MIEGCSDLYGNLVDGQLVSTFSYYFSGAYPELYRYANPEQTLVDMVYPRRNNVMRPEHIGKRSTEMINRTYINNCYSGSTIWRRITLSSMTPRSGSI